MGKSSANRGFSIAMFDYHRVGMMFFLWAQSVTIIFIGAQKKYSSVEAERKHRTHRWCSCCSFRKPLVKWSNSKSQVTFFFLPVFAISSIAKFDLKEISVFIDLGDEDSGGTSSRTQPEPLNWVRSLYVCFALSLFYVVAVVRGVGRLTFQIVEKH
jgi:hypothetical protein